MKVIRVKQAHAIKRIAVNAVKEALKGEGLKVSSQGMHWTASGMQITIDLALPYVKEIEIQRQKDEARKLCPKFGLPMDTFVREFYIKIKKAGKTRVKVVDIKPRNHKYPIIVEVFDHSSRYHEKRFKCSPGQVKRGLGVK